MAFQALRRFPATREQLSGAGVPHVRTTYTPNYAVTPSQRISMYLGGLADKPLYGVSVEGQKKLAQSLNLEGLGRIQPLYLQALQGLEAARQRAQAYQPAVQASLAQALAAMQHMDPATLAALASRSAAAQALNQGLAQARQLQATNPALGLGARVAAYNAANRAGNDVLAQGLSYENLLGAFNQRANSMAQLGQLGVQATPDMALLQVLAGLHGQHSNAVMGAQRPPERQQQSDPFLQLLGQALPLFK